MSRSMVGGASGYIPLGSKVSLGPLASFIGYNTLEGLRAGLGAVTSPALSRHLRLSGYGAYGFGDRRWKYMAGAEWSVPPVEAYYGEYRVNTIGARYGYDTEPLGDNALGATTARAPFGVSLRRNEMMLYRRSGHLYYTFEPSKRSALTLDASRLRYYPTRYLDFGTLSTLDAWRVAVTARLTPGGDFIQTRRGRLDVYPYAPRIAARLQWVAGASGADATSLLIPEATLSKVFPLAPRRSTLGVIVHGAATIGHGAYPFLPALPSSPYVIRRFGAFGLLRPLELPADRFADLHLRYDDGGLLLGWIPVIDMLGISATASFDIAAGELSASNDPRRSPRLPPLPYTPRHMLSWSRPYSEVGIGLDHILGFARIEYIWRLGYRSNPGARCGGIAIGIDIISK